MKAILHIILLTLFALSATAQTTQRTARAGADGVADTLALDGQTLYLTTTKGAYFSVELPASGDTIFFYGVGC